MERDSRRTHPDNLEVTTVTACQGSRLSRFNDLELGLLNRRIQINFVKSVQSWVMKRLSHI